MTLQRKFLLVVSMLVLALLGSLAAVWWAFGMLQRELAAPFEQTAGVLDELRRIKRNAEDQGRILYEEGVAAPDDAAGALPEQVRAPGVRGPWGEPRRFRPGAGDMEEFREHTRQSLEALGRIRASEAMSARVGVSTCRNLQEKVEETAALAERWFGGDADAQASAGRECFVIHELIETTERQILQNAKLAVSYGETIRSMLRTWLVSVFAAGLLGSVLAVTLLRRWVQKPVSVLREAAARIAQGDLSHRVPVLQRDELGLLSAEVNHMAQMVQVMQDERVERERLAAVGELVRRIVHNVRNPLAGIRGLAEVTRMDFEKGSANRESMDLIVSTVDTFERWLSELLDAASPTKIEPRETGVEEWIGGIVEIHRSQAAARGVTLLVEASGAPPVATFDPKHMDHAVSALVSNAIEATPEGGRVWITARRLQENGVWEVSVADEGAGVPAEVMPRIFEAHFTTKRHGNGLGLAMALQIVKGHAGRIAVENGDKEHPERRGACFRVRMPVDGREADTKPNKGRSP